MNKFAVILAAGKGTRMKSDLPKVLHHVGGKPMVQHIIDKLEKINMNEIIVVIGHGAEKVREQVKGNVKFVEQVEQLGTAHAVSMANPLLKGKEGLTLVVTGDTPLIELDTMQSLMDYHQEKKSNGTVLTAIQENPTGYGRILRNNGSVIGIVEEKDATNIQKQIKEVNTGIYCFDNKSLFQFLSTIDNSNAQNEFYLTDIVSVFLQNSLSFEGYAIHDSYQVMGINNRVQLAEAEKVFRKRVNENHMMNGVTMIDPDNTYIDDEVVIGANTILYPNVVLRGMTVIGKDVVIHSGSEIVNSVIGNGTVVKQSVITDSHIGNEVQIGPFAQIRPKTIVHNKAKVGNFVELKGTVLGEGSKANHLSYIGDAEVGSDVNIGCGTITVNYDGKHKHKTIIEDGAFVGCNANLIAPVKIGKNTIVAAGSTITKNVPNEALAIARTRQENKEGYASKLNSKL